MTISPMIDKAISSGVSGVELEADRCGKALYGLPGDAGLLEWPRASSASVSYSPLLQSIWLGVQDQGKHIEVDAHIRLTSTTWVSEVMGLSARTRLKSPDATTSAPGSADSFASSRRSS